MGNNIDMLIFSSRTQGARDSRLRRRHESRNEPVHSLSSSEDDDSAEVPPIASDSSSPGPSATPTPSLSLESESLGDSESEKREKAVVQSQDTPTTSEMDTSGEGEDNNVEDKVDDNSEVGGDNDGERESVDVDDVDDVDATEESQEALKEAQPDDSDVVPSVGVENDADDGEVGGLSDSKGVVSDDLQEPNTEERDRAELTRSL